METLKGLPASPGIASGKLWYFAPQAPRIDPQPCRDVAAAQQAFAEARGVVDAHLAQLFELVRQRQGEQEAEIFASHRELLDDEELINDINALIAEGKSATAAVDAYLEDAAAQMRTLEDAYLRERAAEFIDLKNNLLLALCGLPLATLEQVPVGSIVVARDLTPSETAQLDVQAVRGFVLEEGGLTSHVAILARNLGLPALMGLKGVMRLDAEGHTALLDGVAGFLVVDPDAETQSLYTQKAEALAARKAEYAQLRDQAATTLDGKTIALYSNIGSAANLHLVEENASAGIGLFRSEFLFMEASTAPDEMAQYAVYRQVLEHVQGRPVILRLLDIGGDKPLSYLEFPKEENPFLGFRGVRIYREHAGLFRSQLRAALRAAVHGDLRLMIPMVVKPEEVQWVKACLDEEAERMTAAGEEVRRLPVGIMIETPAAALIAPQLAQVADFFSIGTNDLTQYTLAVDRGNTAIAELYDGLHPAVLRLMDWTCQAAHAAGIEVGLCGEMGGQAEATPFLVAMGFDEISISGLGVPAVKYDIRHLEYARCRSLLDRALQCPDGQAVRALLDDF